MAGTFDMLRANDLIFNYVVSNWLMGQKPPAFDILAWNADSTRMPAAMHAFYLRNFYVENKLAEGKLEIAGTHDRPERRSSRRPTWSARSTTTSCRGSRPTRPSGLVSGPVRFVLGSGGHIAGIVSPPGPKAWHHGRHRDRRRAAGDRGGWREGAERRTGSWWEDWATWSAEHSGRDAATRRGWAATQAPGARRRAGRVRRGPDAGTAPSSRHGDRQRVGPGSVSCRSAGGLARVRACVARLAGELAGQAAGRDRQRGQHRLQAGAEVAHRQLDRGHHLAARPEHRHRHAAGARLELEPGDRDPGQPGDRQRAAEPVGRGHRVRGVRPQPAHDRHLDDAGRARTPAARGRARSGGRAAWRPG